MSIDRGIAKEDVVCVYTHMWYGMCIHTHMDYYSAMEKKEIMTFAAKWMDLELIMVSEVRERNNYHVI